MLDQAPQAVFVPKPRAAPGAAAAPHAGSQAHRPFVGPVPAGAVQVITAGGRVATVLERKQRGWFAVELDGNANGEGGAFERKAMRRPMFAPGQDARLDGAPASEGLRKFEALREAAATKAPPKKPAAAKKRGAPPAAKEAASMPPPSPEALAPAAPTFAAPTFAAPTFAAPTFAAPTPAAPTPEADEAPEEAPAPSPKPRGRPRKSPAASFAAEEAQAPPKKLAAAKKRAAPPVAEEAAAPAPATKKKRGGAVAADKWEQVWTAGGRVAIIIERRASGWLYVELDGLANDEGAAFECKAIRASATLAIDAAATPARKEKRPLAGGTAPRAQRPRLASSGDDDDDDEAAPAQVEGAADALAAKDAEIDRLKAALAAQQRPVAQPVAPPVALGAAAPSPGVSAMSSAEIAVAWARFQRFEQFLEMSGAVPPRS